MSKNTIKFYIKEEDVGKRLDIVLSEKIDSLTRSNLKKLIVSENVEVDKVVSNSPSKKLKLDQLIEIKLLVNQPEKIKPFNIKLKIIYEDQDIIIINKPSGMVVHPGAGNYEKTLVNALVGKFKNKLSSINGNLRPGIIHRIDKDTSGILVVAKNNFSHSKLSKQFSDHTIQRKYLALVWGSLRPLNGKIKSLIGRNKKNRQLMTVTEMSGKNAITNYKTLKIFNIKDIPRVSLIECELETGRTHQIRVHMQYKGASLLGDKQYGKKNIKFKKINKEFESILSSLNGQVLHAKSLGFIHPKNNKLVSFESGLPKNFKKILNLLEKLSS